MTIIRLNGNSMNTRVLAHSYLKWKLDLPPHYGENLDALWDILSVYSKSLNIKLYNKDKLINHLGEYGQSIIDVLEDASTENDFISFQID